MRGGIDSYRIEALEEVWEREELPPRCTRDLQKRNSKLRTYNDT
jgi:hypothetical protein